MAFHDHNFFQNNAQTAPVNGSSVSALTVTLGVYSPDCIALLQVFASNTAGAAPSISSITDTYGCIWTPLSSFTYDGTNGSRHAVYWARVPCKGRIYVTVNFSASVSLAGISLVIVDGGHLTSPLDVNVDALKTESHTASAASSVSGFSTTAADTIIYSFYGSRTTATNPGLPTGFTNQYANSVNVRLKCDNLVVSSAQSGVSIAYGTASATGSMIAIAIRPRVVARKQIRWLQGFDHYAATNDANGGLSSAVNGEFAFTLGANGTHTLQTGRDGIGQCLRVTGSSSSGGISRTRSDQNRGFGVTAGNTTTNGGLGFGDVLDGEHVYIGMNVKIGTVIGSAAQDWKAVFGFGGTTSGDRITFFYDITARKWGMTLLPGTSGTTSPSNGNPTPDFVVTPDWDVLGKWCWVEIHLYRHASAGRIEMWAESASFHQQFPNPLFYRGVVGGHKSRHRVYRSNGNTGEKPIYTMAKIFDYTGDTSVATLSNVESFNLIGDNSNGSNKHIGCDFDDFVLSTGDRMAGPCYVRTLYPDSDVSTSGWSPSTGTDHFGVVDETLYDRTDYLTASTGNPYDKLGVSAGIGYTPKQVHAVQAGWGVRNQSADSNKQGCARVISGSAEVPGYHRSIASTTQDEYLLMCCPHDPATRAPWSYTAAKAASIGIEVPTVDHNNAAQSLASEKRAYQAFKSILATIEHGTGTAGTPDDPDSPGTDTGTSDVSALLTTLFQPIPNAISKGVQFGDFHPIDQGIVV